METEDRLLELIQSMTRQEKRYFKLYSSFYSKKNSKKCVVLFDILNKAGQDKNKVQKLLAKQFSAAGLPRFKNELFVLVLDSLVSFRAQHLSDKEIRTLLEYVEVLLEKGLQRQAAKLLAKAKKMATDVENHLMKLQVLFWERSLVLSRYDKDVEFQLQNVYQEVKAETVRQQTWQQYAQLQDRSVLLWGSRKQQADASISARLNELFADQAIVQESQATTVRARIARYHILGLKALSQNQYEQAIEHSSALIKLYEAHPALMANNLNQYTRYLLQHLTILVESKQHAQVFELVTQIKGMTHLPQHLYLITVLGAMSVELTLLINMRNAARAAEVVQEITAYLRYNNSSIHPQNYINLCHNCMAFHFLMGNYPAALELLNLILVERRVTLRKDIQDCARAFSLVLHYELGNSEVLENLIRSTRRYLKKRDQADTLEHLITETIRRLISIVDTSQKSQLFAELIHNLEKLQQANQAQMVGIDELQLWAKSHTGKTGIRELYLAGEGAL